MTEPRNMTDAVKLISESPAARVLVALALRCAAAQWRRAVRDLPEAAYGPAAIMHAPTHALQLAAALETDPPPVVVNPARPSSPPAILDDAPGINTDGIGG